MSNISEKRICQNCRGEFAIEPEDFNFYEKIKVPPPTFCPECRLQRRIAFRNERSLYKDTCDLCKKSFVSMYSPDSFFTVYCKECWYSDSWDPFQYGRDYDWKKSFLEQFKELMKIVPRIGIMHIHTNINADYANYVADSKNVYLSQSVIAKSENVYYSRGIDTGKDIFDCFYVKESERCYEAIDSSHIYQSQYLIRSRECINSAFLFDCVNCQNCFMSASLRNKQYVIRNIQYSKEQYKIAMTAINLGSHLALELLKKEFVDLVKSSLHKFSNIVKCVNSTGDNLENSKNVKVSFSVYNAENSKFLTRVVVAKDSYDITGAVRPELTYEGMATGYESYNSKFLDHVEAIGESHYCDWCQSSENLFGCIGIRRKKYCILNKQYTEEEYRNLVSKIITHMNELPYIDKGGHIYKYGEFFPIELSPFGYNETYAQEYFPINKKEALSKGYNWYNPKPLPYRPTIKVVDLPDEIHKVPDSIADEIIACGNCGRAYRIIKSELEFLRREVIALPRVCEHCRYQNRFNLRNPLKLWHRTCMCEKGSHLHGGEKCQVEFETSYAPDRPEIVYCEKCYQQEVY